MTDRFDARAPRGWVLYDARCPLCTNLIGRVRASLEAGGFVPAPLQSTWVRRRLNLPEELLLKEMRVLTPDGRVLGGADALIYLAGNFDARCRPWWAWLLLAVSKLPFAMPVLRGAYRAVAARRFCRQGSCPIPKPTIPTKEGIR
jgi:predicted DCC family thiol-disulfide oxidoreductase YuxK